MPAILSIEKLQTHFKTMSGLVKAADGVSLHINEHEIVGIVGESGCGKSVTMLSVMQLIADPPGKIVGGKVLFKGDDLLKYGPDSSEMRSLRGGKIAMIFQEPMTSLNPTLTIYQQLAEMLQLHLGMNRKDTRARTIELLRQVGVPEPETRVDDYPHQFSGGMRQRAMIAMALSCNPKILIADEPTTALDVTTQAQILRMMQDLVSSYGTSLVIVTHNLGVVARYAQRIYIMYAGRVVESGSAEDIFRFPSHPYTIGLLNCVPRLDEEVGRKLVPIKGMPPNLINMPPTCAFLPRCNNAVKKCREEVWPGLREIGNNHFISCYVDVREKL